MATSRNSAVMMRPISVASTGPCASSPKKTRIIELDFVRGMAILLVMGFHFQARSTIDPPSSVLLSVLRDFGAHGVDIFFVLSGFLVGGLLLKEYDRTGGVNVARFVVRRGWKIWPSYYFYLAVIAVSGRHELRSFLGPNLLHIQNYLGTSLKHTWSLAVEEHFYLLLPILLIGCLKGVAPSRRLDRAVGLVLVAVFVVRSIQVWAWGAASVFAPTHTRLDALLFGVWLAGVKLWRPDLFKKWSTHGWLLGVLAVVPVLLCVSGVSPVTMATVGYTVVYLGAGGLLLFVLQHSGGIRQFIGYRVIAWVGMYSYGIYLWHNSVQSPVEMLAAHAPVLRYFWMVMLLKTLSAVALGVVTTWVIEWPALRLRERFSPEAGTGTSTAGKDFAAA